MARLRLGCRRLHSIRAHSLVSAIIVSSERQLAVRLSFAVTASLRLNNHCNNQASARTEQLPPQPWAVSHLSADSSVDSRAVVVIFLGTSKRIHRGHGNGLLSI